MCGILYRKWRIVVAVVLMMSVLAVGCGSEQPPAPAAESASEDKTESSEAAQTAETTAVPEEEIRITPETALVGICLARTPNGDNDRLLYELKNSLITQGFQPENIIVKGSTRSRSRQAEAVGECLSQGCSIVIVSAVSDKKIPELADMITENGSYAVFVSCTPEEEELTRWEETDMPAVWIGVNQEQITNCQMTIFYDYIGSDRGPDFNGDGAVGTLLVGGDKGTEKALKETIQDLGFDLKILGRTDSDDAEEISLFTQENLNEYRKEAELVLCCSESSALAASEGVQLRHRLVGRDILVIGTDAHEEICTAIINKLMSGATFVDFYEQASLTAIAAYDLIDGNQKEKKIAGVIFKVTEENAQEVLDQLWNLNEKIEKEAENSAEAETSAESMTGDAAERAEESATGASAETAAEDKTGDAAERAEESGTSRTSETAAEELTGQAAETAAEDKTGDTAKKAEESATSRTSETAAEELTGKSKENATGDTAKKAEESATGRTAETAAENKTGKTAEITARSVTGKAVETADESMTGRTSETASEIEGTRVPASPAKKGTGR